jgi:hypothetical protein
MDATNDVTDPGGPPEDSARWAFRLAAAVAFLVPWATQFGGPAGWTNTLLPIAVWLVLAATGVAGVIAGGRGRRVGTALIAGDALGVVLFLVSFFVVLVFSYGGETGGG